MQFVTDLAGVSNSTASVDVSVNDGKTWSKAWRNAGILTEPGPATVVIPLPAAGKTGARVRFGYTGQWSQYWGIDNVFLGNRTCARQPGGLLGGRVADSSGK